MYTSIEGTDQYATITVVRNPLIYSGTIMLQYATSDLSATGVDSVKFAACQDLAPNQRGAALCGDYEQTFGIVTILQGSNYGGFTVKIMNDLCREPYMKYLQLTLSVPGSAALQGRSLVAKMRIDDDDFLQGIC